MPTTVNKIGGKNMSQLEQVRKLVDVLGLRGENIVLVVSAFEGVTNTLIKAMDELNGKDYYEADIAKAFGDTTQIHEGIVEKYFREGQKKEALEACQAAFDVLTQSLMAHKRTSKIMMPVAGSFSIRDQVIGFGENMAGKLLEIFLRQEEKQARFFDGVQCDSTVMGNGVVSNRKMERGIQEGLKKSLATETRTDVIRVLGGHIGGTPRGIAIDEGRGYSDITAVDTAIALKDRGEDVSAVRFWKDVDGVFTANPKDLNPIKNKPVLHRDISIREALENAAAGSSLINVRALSRALKNGMDLQIRNIHKSELDIGTNVTPSEVVTHHAFKTIVSNPNMDTITISIPEMADEDGFAAAITQVFAKHGISMDGIFTEGTGISFSVPMPQDESDREAHRNKLRDLLTELKEIEVKGERYTVSEAPRWDKGRFASISVIGKELHDQVGILANISGVFSAFGINIAAVVHGTLQTRINYLIDQQDRARAVQLLHSIFVDNYQEVIREFRQRRADQTDALTRTFRT
jgi:aspartate kinase